MSINYSLYTSVVARRGTFRRWTCNVLPTPYSCIARPLDFEWDSRLGFDRICMLAEQRGACQADRELLAAWRGELQPAQSSTKQHKAARSSTCMCGATSTIPESSSGAKRDILCRHSLHTCREYQPEFLARDSRAKRGEACHLHATTIYM